MMKIKLLFIISALFILACSSQSEENRLSDRTEIRENLLEANALLIDAEDQEIRDFIDRYGWEMKATGSGLRYMIYHEGSGPKAEKDHIAHLNYTISLITGDQIYSSENDGLRQFQIGRGGVESGLEEGILLLSAGDKARFILPSHLAHGLPGDGVKIPKRATIIYDIELVDITSK